MAEITDFETWLKTRPPEDAVLIAARAALRVLPLIQPALPHEAGLHRAGRVLPTFRALAVANSVGTWPSRIGEVKDAALQAAQFTSIGFGAPIANVATRAAAIAANLQTGPAAADAVARAADAARRLIGGDCDSDFSNDFSKGGHTSIWQYVALEAAALEAGMSHEALGGTQLWPGASFSGTRSGSTATTAVPGWADDQWRALKQHLLDAGEDWEVWVNWYDVILAGHPLDPHLELKKARIPELAWKRPAVVNAEIARLIAEHQGEAAQPQENVHNVVLLTPEENVAVDGENRADVHTDEPARLPDVPPPRPSPLRFTVVDGTLRISEPPVSAIASGAEDGWSMLRDAVSEMLNGRAAGNHAVGAALEMALRALGTEFAAFNPLRLGLVGITLQQLADRADEVLLAEEAAHLHAIVIQQQLLVAQYPAWRQYSSAIAPAMSDPDTEQAAADGAARIAVELIERHPDAVDPEAAQAITDAAETATPQPTPDDPNPHAPAEARRGWIRVFREFIRAWARQSLDEGSKMVARATAGIFCMAWSGWELNCSSWLSCFPPNSAGSSRLSGMFRRRPACRAQSHSAPSTPVVSCELRTPRLDSGPDPGIHLKVGVTPLFARFSRIADRFWTPGLPKLHADDGELRRCALPRCFCLPGRNQNSPMVLAACSRLCADASRGRGAFPREDGNVEMTKTRVAGPRLRI